MMKFHRALEKGEIPFVKRFEEHPARWSFKDKLEENVIPRRRKEETFSITPANRMQLEISWGA